MNILGISAFYHDSAAALIQDGRLVAAAEEERFSRIKHDFGYPKLAIQFCLESGGITAKEGMEQPIYYWDPVIAPSGMAFYTSDLFPAWKGSLFVGGHGTLDLVRLSLDGDKVIGEERLLTDMDPKPKVRDVRQGPEGALYVLIDSTAGKLIKLVPKR